MGTVIPQRGVIMDLKQEAYRLNQDIRITDLCGVMGIDLDWTHANYPSLVGHDSWIIDVKKNRNHWNSRHLIGGGVVDFYRWASREYNHRDIPFKEAVQELQNLVKTGELKELTNEEKKKTSFVRKELNDEERNDYLQNALNQLHYGFDNEYAEKNMAFEEAKEYLCAKRKISFQVFYLFEKQRRLLQINNKMNKNGHDVAFIGYTHDGKIGAICSREIKESGGWKGDFSNCNYKIGWFCDPEWDQHKVSEELYNHIYTRPDPNKTLFAFESVIEMMSFMSLVRTTGHDIKEFAYIATGATTKAKCVEEACKEYGYKDVVISFNNDIQSELKNDSVKDNAGKIAAIRLKDRLAEQGVTARIMLPAYRNDWNDTLKSVYTRTKEDIPLVDGSILKKGMRLDSKRALDYFDERPGKEQIKDRSFHFGFILDQSKETSKKKELIPER